jgi:hypothetical protein
MTTTIDGPVGGPRERARRASRIADRRRQVASLLLLHWTYEQIAHRLRVSVGTVAADVKVIRREWREAQTADYQEFVDEHLAVLRELEEKVLAEALTLSANGRVRLWAVDRVIQIRDRIAALKGLNEPAKVEVTMKVELVGRALELTLAELGVDAAEAKPIMARHLRAIEA